MGNIRMSMVSSPSEQPNKKSIQKQESPENFKFLQPFAEETNNGLYLNNIYCPEEVIIMILSYIDAKDLLEISLVCKKWFNIVRSDSFWMSIYSRKYSKKPKKLPWYVYYCFFATNYFNKNLIKNGNGQEQFKHWKIVFNYGDEFRIEDPPCGADPLPADVPEFNGKTSCFATSYYECNKYQDISLQNNNIMQLIMDKYKPYIYVSEWVAGRFDCACVYYLWCNLYEGHNKEDNPIPNLLHSEKRSFKVEQWMGRKWSKIEILIKDYPAGVRTIWFQHEGKDDQFWKGHYGAKMAGGVLKILFDSIEA